MAVHRVSQQLALFLFLAIMLLLPIPKAGMMPFALPILIGFAVLIFLSTYISSIYAYGTSSGLSRREKNQKKITPWVIVYFIFLVFFSLSTWVWPIVLGWERFFGLRFDNLNLPMLSDMDAFGGSKLRSLALLAFFSVVWFACWKTSVLNRKQIKLLIWVFLISSLFQAVFGLWHLLSLQSGVLGLWEKQFFIRDATGTFVNRNHYAGFLAICWPVVLAGLLARKPFLFSNIDHYKRLLIAIFYSLIVFLAIVASHSRMGVVASVFGVVIWFYFESKNNWHLNQRVSPKRSPQSAFSKLSSRFLLKWFLVLIFLLFIIWFGIDDLLERYLQLENGDSRFSVWSAMFDLPVSALLLGIGPGAFADVFPLVQPSYFAYRFEYAHSDYIEFLFEFGIIGTSLLVLSLIYWIWRVFPKGQLSMRAGALGAIAAMGLHSSVDFTLQIPASALYFWITVGLVMNPHMLNEND